LSLLVVLVLLGFPIALVLAPDLAESHVSAGIAHCMLKDYDKAETEFAKAVELDPKSYDACIRLVAPGARRRG
jgi:tetratricopeptide (TPR) repeat protein